MTAVTTALSHRLRLLLAAACLGAMSALISAPALARGPEGIADVAEKVIDSVVNISTSQTVEAKGGDGPDHDATDERDVERGPERAGREGHERQRRHAGDRDDGPSHSARPGREQPLRAEREHAGHQDVDQH